jgi:hypothetical protein
MSKNTNEDNAPEPTNAELQARILALELKDTETQKTILKLISEVQSLRRRQEPPFGGVQH